MFSSDIIAELFPMTTISKEVGRERVSRTRVQIFLNSLKKVLLRFSRTCVCFTRVNQMSMDNRWTHSLQSTRPKCALFILWDVCLYITYQSRSNPFVITRGRRQENVPPHWALSSRSLWTCWWGHCPRAIRSSYVVSSPTITRNPWWVEQT